MSTATSIQFNLVSRPQGVPTSDDVVRVEVDLAELADGEVRVANEFLSVDPYMRGRMNDVRSYIPPFALGEALTGAAVGRVVESRSPDFSVGDTVQHQLGWRDVAQAPASAFRAAPRLPGLPLSVYLGALGISGITAWVGLTVIAKLREGDTVFVSGAAFDYKDGDVRGQLRDAAPDGIDVYFDNVGGEHLEAALEMFNDGGRAALCGAIAAYNSTGDEPGTRFLGNIVTRGLTLQGFTMTNYGQYAPQFAADMQSWLADGSIVFDETIVSGVDNTFDAFTGMMRGDNVGKMVVAI